MADDAELIKAGTQGLVEGTLAPFHQLILSLFGPAADEAGLILRDYVRHYGQRQFRFLQRTRTVLTDAQIAAQPVPLKLLKPIIENATIEDDDELQDIWANMLANAADPRDVNPVIPAFPVILKELSPLDVKFLDLLYVEADDRVAHPRKMQKPVRSVDAVTFETVFLQTLYATKVLNMTLEPGKALRLDPESMQSRAIEELQFARNFAFTMDLLQRHQLLAEVIDTPPGRFVKEPPQFMLHYRFSHLGTCFVKACRKPN